MHGRLIRWWQARSERERRTLIAWGSAIILLLLWFGAISPLATSIDALEKRIPTLETQLNKMRAQPAGEKLRTQARQSGEDLRSTLFSLLAEKKIHAELRALSTSRAEMRLPPLPMQEAIDLLTALRRESGARIAVLNIKTETSAAPLIIVELERGQ